MSLVREIRELAIRSDIPVSDLLRRCALLGAQLKNDELRDWAFLELRGYGGSVTVPSYRVLPAHATGNFSGAFGTEIRGFTIPASLLPKDLRRYAEQIVLRNSIAEIEAFALANEEKGFLSCPWPGDLVRIMQDKIFADMALLSAAQLVSKASMLGVVDAVRNRILEFVMKIEEEAHDGNGNDTPKIPSERVNQLFNTIINGNVSGDVIAGVGGSVTVVNTNDLAGLKAAMTALGIPEAEVHQLEKAILEDQKTAHGMGGKTAQWLKAVGDKIGSGVLKVGAGVGIGLVTKLILAYFGLS